MDDRAQKKGVITEQGRSSHGDFPSNDWLVDDSYRGILVSLPPSSQHQSVQSVSLLPRILNIHSRTKEMDANIAAVDTANYL